MSRRPRAWIVLGHALLVVAACWRGSTTPTHADPLPLVAASTPLPPPPAASAASSAAPAAASASSIGPFDFPPGYVVPAVWETRAVVVDGVTEKWSLVWRKPPSSNTCTTSTMCPCEGVAWGLQGELELVRERPGQPVERLDLAAIHYEGVAQIPGFAEAPLDDPEYGDHADVVRPGKWLRDVVTRPHPPVMTLADYDHDGRATEFVYQIGYEACFQTPCVLVGISRSNPHLHVFGTAEQPTGQLVMTYRKTWETILHTPRGTFDVEQRFCGDHGLAAKILKLRIDDAGFHVLDDAWWECDMKRTPPRRIRRLPNEGERP